MKNILFKCISGLAILITGSILVTLQSCGEEEPCNMVFVNEDSLFLANHEVSQDTAFTETKRFRLNVLSNTGDSLSKQNDSIKSLAFCSLRDKIQEILNSN